MDTTTLHGTDTARLRVVVNPSLSLDTCSDVGDPGLVMLASDAGWCAVPVEPCW